MQAFAMFASDLDDASKRQLARGERLMQLLRQPVGHPMKASAQVVSLWCALNGYIDNIPVDKVLTYEHGVLDAVSTKTKVLDNIEATGELTADDEAKLKAVVADYSDMFVKTEVDDGKVKSKNEQIAI
jgi:F-type H+-transporting ATPase subunit alpha